MIPKPSYVHKFASENTNPKSYPCSISIAHVSGKNNIFISVSNYLELRTAMRRLFRLQNLSVHTKAKHVFDVVKIAVFSKTRYRGLEKQQAKFHSYSR